MGIPVEDAKVLTLFFHGDYYAAALARAMREKDSRYAGATFHLCGLLSRQLAEERGPPAQALYRHLRGAGSLVEEDPAWERLEESDEAGFQGVLTTSITQ